MKKYKVTVNGTVYEVTVEAMDGAAPAAAAPAAAPAPAACGYKIKRDASQCSTSML